MTYICAPVTAKNFTSAVKQLHTAEKEADIIELRADLMEKVGKEGLEYLIKNAKKPIIVTYRSVKEGGNKRGSEKERSEFLKSAITAGAAFVDIELSTNPKIRNSIVRHAKKNGTKVIISFHDFNKTPPLNELVRFTDKAIKAGADIIKTATWKKTEKDDAKASMLLRYCKAKGKPGIVLTMHKTDSSMRFNAIKLGAFLTFGRIGKGSAPGQPTVQELKKFRKKVASINTKKLKERTQKSRKRILQKRKLK